MHICSTIFNVIVLFKTECVTKHLFKKEDINLVRRAVVEVVQRLNRELLHCTKSAPSHALQIGNPDYFASTFPEMNFNSSDADSI